MFIKLVQQGLQCGNKELEIGSTDAGIMLKSVVKERIQIEFSQRKQFLHQIYLSVLIDRF